MELRAPGITDTRVLSARSSACRASIFVPGDLPRPGLREHRAADRPGPDHQPAAGRGADDPGAGRSASATRCWRSAPARAIRRRCWPTCAAGVFTIERHRALAEGGRGASAVNCASTTSRSLRRRHARAGRSRRHSTASSSPPRPRACRSTDRKLAEGGVMVVPVGEERRDQELMRRAPDGGEAGERGSVPGAFRAAGRGLPRGADALR